MLLFSSCFYFCQSFDKFLVTSPFSPKLPLSWKRLVINRPSSQTFDQKLATNSPISQNSSFWDSCPIPNFVKFTFLSKSLTDFIFLADLWWIHAKFSNRKLFFIIDIPGLSGFFFCHFRQTFFAIFVILFQFLPILFITSSQICYFRKIRNMMIFVVGLIWTSGQTIDAILAIFAEIWRVSRFPSLMDSCYFRGNRQILIIPFLLSHLKFLSELWWILAKFAICHCFFNS